MSEVSGEMTHIKRLEKDGLGRAGKAESFLLRPPLSDREVNDLTPGTRGEKLSEEEARVLEKLDDSAVMARVSILSDEVEIDGAKGSLLIYDAQPIDEQLMEDLALFGSVICTLRGQPTLDLSLTN